MSRAERRRRAANMRRYRANLRAGTRVAPVKIERDVFEALCWSGYYTADGEDRADLSEAVRRMLKDWADRWLREYRKDW